MKVFLQNRNFRQLTINQWISTVGDTIFLSGLFELCGRCIFCPFGDFTDHDFRNPSSSSANLSGSDKETIE